MSLCTVALLSIAGLICIISAVVSWRRSVCSGSRKSSENARISCPPEICLGIGAMIVGALVSIAAISNDAYTDLTGQLNTWIMSDSSKDDEANNMSIGFVASLQNPSNNPISIDRVYVEFDDGDTIDLAETSADVSDNQPHYHNAEIIGFPVGAHEAARINLVLSENRSTELIGSKMKACYVVDTMGKVYGLDIEPIVRVAKDSVVNEFTLVASE